MDIFGTPAPAAGGAAAPAGDIFGGAGGADIFGAPAPAAGGAAPAPAPAGADIFGSTPAPAPAATPAPAPAAAAPAPAADIFGNPAPAPAAPAAAAPAPAAGDIFGAPAPAAGAPAPAPAPAAGGDIFGAGATPAPAPAAGGLTVQIGDGGGGSKDAVAAAPAPAEAPYVPGKNRFLNSIQNMTLQEIEKLVRDEKLRLKGEFKKLSERAFHLQHKYVEVEAEMLGVVDAAHWVHFYLDDKQIGAAQKGINESQKELLRVLGESEKAAQSKAAPAIGRGDPQELQRRKTRKKSYNTVLQLVDELQHMENQVEELKNRINASSQRAAAGSGRSDVDKILKILNSHHSVYTHVDAEADAILQELDSIRRGRM